jgi:hypothetical protein
MRHCRMTNIEERIFMLDLAVVQLIAGILVTLGSTLFAISIGFGLTIPNTMKDALIQLLTMGGEISPEVPHVLVYESLSNYVLILALFSVLLIVAGVVFASVKFNKIKTQIKASRAAENLIRTDIKQVDPILDNPVSETTEAV